MNALVQARWRRLPALQPMSRLNERMIETMVDLARRPEPPPEPYALVTPLRNRLRHFDAASRRRLAELPFLLVDLRLTDEIAWERCLKQARRGPERTRRRTAEESRSIALARGVTLLAWHFVQTHADGAAVHFGMSQQVASLLRRADVLDLEEAASSLAPQCRPRWGDRPSAWAYLLARSESDASPLRDETVYGLQLLGSDLLRIPGKSPARKDLKGTSDEPRPDSVR